MRRTHGHPRQNGAITLLVAIGLVVLASLTSHYSSRSVFMDRLAAENHARTSQSRLAAEAALATAQAAIASASAPFEALLTQSAPCPPGVQGPQWQCVVWPVPAHPAWPQAERSVTGTRDLVMAPHVLTLYAQSRLSAQSSRGQVRESLFLPVLSPAPAQAPQAALVLNGCVSEAAAASLRVCPLSQTGQACSGSATAPAVLTHFVNDTDRNGSISVTEKTACMGLASRSLPAGGSQSGPDHAVSRSPCNRAAWRSVLGDITPAQLQAWSSSQERNGLHALSTPPRTIYWIDSPADWRQSVGTPAHPVLLVFSSQACALRCPRIAPGVSIHGSVVLDSGCDDEKMRGWQGGWIEGQLVVESGLPQWLAGTVWARPDSRKAYWLDWPEGMDTSRVQRVNGSWSEGTP